MENANTVREKDGMSTTELNSSQRAFCEAPLGNIRLLAPAGCGKTLCLLYRCNHIVEQSRAQRPRLLMVTFTRAARDELLTRLNEDKQFSALRDLTEITTLNSWGFRRIRNATFNPRLLTSRDQYHFTVLNQLQSVWQRHARIKYAIEQKRNVAPGVIMDVVDAFKSLGFDHTRITNYESFSQYLDELENQNLQWRLDEQIDELTKLGMFETRLVSSGAEAPRAGKQEVYNTFFRFWREATEHLIGNATFTLEDQKYFAYLDERQKTEDGSLLSGAARYTHILVDEFQDINPLDLKLVKAIAQRNRATVTIAGDDDQAIFEWRGATPEYVLDPDQFFGAKFDTYTLGVNYRSPANIVEHSLRLIENNTRRVPKKEIKASGNDLARIEVQEIDSLDDALDCVSGIVEQSISQGTSPARVAIVGRKRSQIIPFQVYFASKFVPYCAAEDLQIFLSDTFKRLLELLSIKTGAQSGQSKRQAISALLQLCDLVKWYQLSKSDREGLRSHLQSFRIATLDDAIGALASYRGKLKGPNTNGKMSMNMAVAIKTFVDSTTVSDALIALSDYFEGLQIDLGKAADDIFYADPPFFQLAEYASRYGRDYDQFIEDIELAREQLVYTPPFDDDSEASSTSDLQKRPVHLMTALRAKGKEFDTVVLLNVIEGIWPSRYARTPAEQEAERRVFYVAFTRARKNIVMLVDKHIGTDLAIASRYINELRLA